MAAKRFLTAFIFILILGGVAGAAIIHVGEDVSVTTPDTAPIDNPGVSPEVDDGDGIALLYREVRDSVVAINVQNSNGGSQGSGFVYDSEGHIVTNEHVVRRGDTYDVRYNNGEWREAEVIGTDKDTDLAVLEVSDPPSEAEALPVANSSPRRGIWVVALGNPFGLESSITQGIVSGVNRSMVAPDGFSIPDVVQTDAAINPGNSGGPLVNMRGVVVGVIRAKQGSNIGFAISPEIVNRVVPELIRSGGINHPFMGVSTRDVTPSLADELGMDQPRGVLVVRVLNNSPSVDVLRGSDTEVTINGRQASIGGDVIIQIDDKNINSQEELASYLMTETSPGEEISVRVIRDGEIRNLSLTLGTRPE